MDKFNSARIYPNSEEVVEEPIRMYQSGPRIYTFNTKISRSQNILGDPSLDCIDYGATSVHVTKHLYGVRLRDLVYMTSIYMK